MTFCDISKCHNVTLLNFVTFLVFVTRYVFFLVFLAKPKMSKKHRNVTNPQPVQTLFRGSANIYVSKLRRFTVVWLGQIQNLDTGHVYVLGFKSGSERL